jgi:hypothetical protein
MTTPQSGVMFANPTNPAMAHIPVVSMVDINPYLYTINVGNPITSPSHHHF